MRMNNFTKLKQAQRLLQISPKNRVATIPSSASTSSFFVKKESSSSSALGAPRLTIKAKMALPVIHSLLTRASAAQIEKPLKKTAIFYVHHSLETSVNLVEAIIALGAQPKNIFVLEKHYSRCPEVAQKIIELGVYYQPCSTQISLGGFLTSFVRDINWMWSKLIDNIGADIEEILILDHGGHALTYTPSILFEKYKVIGIEKTTSGFINLQEQNLLPPFPLIGVANCAAKKILESPLIAEAVVNKLHSIIPLKDENITCGVVGYGAIGKAVATKLYEMGHKVMVFDSNPEQLKPIKNTKGLVTTNELSSLIAFSDYIFGCSGQDIAAKSLDPFILSPRDKVLISCSSEDKEFLSLIKAIPQRRVGKSITKPLDNIQYRTAMGATIRILRGGFPVNFDHSGVSVPAKDIQLTRALVLAAVLQAVQFFRQPQLLEHSGFYSLNAAAQSFIVNSWLPYQPPQRFAKEIIDNFKNEQWIADNSPGLVQDCDVFKAQSEGQSNENVNRLSA